MLHQFGEMLDLGLVTGSPFAMTEKSQGAPRSSLLGYPIIGDGFCLFPFLVRAMTFYIV